MEKGALEKQISLNIQEAIVKSSKSKSQIAEEIEVSRPTLSQYLSGKIKPSLSTFARLCEVLEISADELLNINK